MSKPAKGLIQAAEDSALSELRERVAGHRPKGRYYLIVCEGTRTEPNYFEAMRSVLTGGEGDKIVVVGAQDNTRRLIDRARIEIEKRNQSDDPPYYHIWIVFDKDSFPDDDFDNAIKMVEQEDSKFHAEGGVLSPHWHAAWSNEAFELWYLFHFQDSVGGAISREQFSGMLSNYLGYEYKKNAEDMFSILLPNLGAAIKRAERAYKRWADDVPFHARNPATNVFELVANLMMYL